VPLLGEISVPVVILVGEHDAITPPAESELMHQHLPSARLVSIDQAGHMANLENPDAFNAALVALVTSVATADRRAR